MFFGSRRPSRERSALRKAATVRVEALETRSLMAAAFTAPDLSPFITAALNGVNTGPATIQKMVTALQSQLTSGPLASLEAGTSTQAVFASDVSSLVTSFQANVDQQLSPRFPNIDKILKLDATYVDSLITTLDLKATDGLIDAATLNTQAANAINSLTGGPLLTLSTPFSGFVQATRSFETDLNSLVPTLDSTSTTPLTLAQVQAEVAADANAYSSGMAVALYLKPSVDAQVNTAVTTLDTSVAAITADTSSSEQAALTAAITAFDVAVLDTTGIFGPQGEVAKGLKQV
jgi:hypothetical protein